MANKRTNRQKVKCNICHQELSSDNFKHHVKAKHNGQNVTYSIPQEPKQKRLCFEKIPSVPSSRKIDKITEPQASNISIETQHFRSDDESAQIQIHHEIEYITDTDQEMASPSKKRRTNCQNVKCNTCQEELDSDNFKQHVTANHKGQDVKCTILQEPKQKRLCLDKIPSVPSYREIVKMTEPQASNISKIETQHLSGDDEFGQIQIYHEIEDITDTDQDQNVVTNICKSQNQTQDQIKVSPDNTFDIGDIASLMSDCTLVKDKTLSVLPECTLDKINTNLNEDKHRRYDEPSQPDLPSYCPKKCGKENFERDFQYDWFKTRPWLSYLVETHEASCFPCEVYSNTTFRFTNWKKTDRLVKHATSIPHLDAMLKWMNAKKNEKNKSTILDLMESQHQVTVKKTENF